ncbi:DUF4185 domain-containing protein [Dysgonomonas sp. Marseille-P4677]|nr:DUF4185 domain-containing protein [Dysgonomonas sp. Marseille-P4677]MBK5720613.1 DUF4185 domain-containing protein [Dysgonomonas sp. Marseille-P4677]
MRKRHIIFQLLPSLLLLFVCQNNCLSQSVSKDGSRGIVIKKVEQKSRVTGTPMEGETLFNPNNTPQSYDVGGTDLGIIWEMKKGKYGIFFGDTYGSDFKPNPQMPGPNGGNWRCNVLAFSYDQNLEDGMTISNMTVNENGKAREIVYGAKDISGEGDWTSIPTAAVRANGADYVHYFNMKKWDGWITNYSGIYKSIDDGQTWTKCKNIYFGSNSNFGQAGYFKKDDYVYMVGTETGRKSSPRVARFRETDIENQTKYEYWNKDLRKWFKGDESKATNLFDDAVGELSIVFHNKYKRWIMTYLNEERYEINLRDAAEITGEWSEPKLLATGKEYPQLYGPYIHPLSLNGDNLYFHMSLWLPYNVFMMKAELVVETKLD